MNTPTNHRELLLFKATTFARQQFSIMKRFPTTTRMESLSQELENSGRSGFLKELFQASNKQEVAGSRLFIWQVDKYSSFLHLSLGDSPLCTDKAASVDPHFFWSTLNLN